MKSLPALKKYVVCALLLLVLLTVFSSAKRAPKPRLLPLTSIHIVDRNGFSETISNKDRLEQFQLTNFLGPQPYQKVLRIYARDSKGNVRSVVTSYHSNGNPKQFLEIMDGRAFGGYREWHENGKMSVCAKVIGGTADITQGAEQTWLFDGTSNAWDEEGHLVAEIPYSQGTLEGIAVYYHASGQVWKRIPYVKGQADGVVEIFRDGGDLLQQVNYVKGRKNGLTTRYWDLNQIASQEEYCDGRLENAQYYDKKGILISEIKHGCGYRATFGKECLNELQEYRQGILEGEVKVYTSQGKFKRIYHVKNNLKHGEEIEYYEQIIKNPAQECEGSPLPHLSFNWYDGKIHGPTKTWYSNGILESQREMSNNKKHGLSMVWYENGDLMMIEEYEQGNLVRGDYFRQGEKIPVSQVILGKGTVTLFDANGRYVQKIAYLNGKPDQL